MFFNLSTIEPLTKADGSLSMILNSKYITAEVTNAINALTMLAKDTDDHGHRTDSTDPNENTDEFDPVFDEEVLNFDEPERESMYTSNHYFIKNSIR